MPLTVPPLLDLFIGALDPRLATATSVTPQSADAAHYSSFQVRRRVTVTTVNFRVGAQNGDVDIGYYLKTGSSAALLSSTEGFTVPAPAVKVSRALIAPVTFWPGLVYLTVLAATNATAGFGGLTAAAMPFPTTDREHIGIIGSKYPLPPTLDLSTAVDTGKQFCILPG